MKRLNKLEVALYYAGALSVLMGAAVFPLGWGVAPYLASVGGVVFAAMQTRAGYEGMNIVIRRLRRQQILGAWLLPLSGVLMGLQSWHIGRFQRNEWLLVLVIAAVFQLYTAWRIPSELEKEK